MKMRRDFCNNGLSYIVMWMLTCLLLIFSTTITVKSTINEIGKVTSKDATNQTCPPIMCELYCVWGFEIDPVTNCPICSCCIPWFCAIFCPESETCEPNFDCIPQLPPSIPCPIIRCVNITSSSTV
ncbi:uncharacterized protein [Mycetomoellerius zeteki]|uniref:uncharacterized protein n=1 Tax=Mycetomoellerius zeteki TaxID=64791 RepID=UPI00084E5B6A|nr:PREDICTED: uncharacterized protein LOC108723903 [Trachymyrmex zeteki]XP_018305441.1 PREDICTED: uncharacterized protein LOC108723903 [Trachymyrmex zeteki]